MQAIEMVYVPFVKIAVLVGQMRPMCLRVIEYAENVIKLSERINFISLPMAISADDASSVVKFAGIRAIARRRIELAMGRLHYLAISLLLKSAHSTALVVSVGKRLSLLIVATIIQIKGVQNDPNGDGKIRQNGRFIDILAKHA